MSLDKLKIKVESGSGGKGIISREKLPPYSADGGNGGRGGNIILNPNKSFENFLHLKEKRLFKAEDGKNGGTNNKTGANGENLVIDLPYLTVIEYEDKKIVLKEPLVILKGGKGGIGNSSLGVNNETKSKPPETGISLDITLKINIIADIGLVGKPNAGKSSFVNQFTNSKSFIADYPFSTLKPQLGVWEFKKQRLTILDIPGLILGASKGKGLGNEFLRYVDECKLLIIILDASNDYLQDFKELEEELKIFGIKKPMVIVLNKIDLITKNERLDIFKQFPKHKVFPISIKQKIDLEPLCKYIFKEYNKTS